MADEAASQRESLWVLQAQSGSHEALNELFRSVQEPLFRYIISLVRDQHLAEDILQETMDEYGLSAADLGPRDRPMSPTPNLTTRYSPPRRVPCSWRN